MADENGVWRTVGGRKIFIRDGQNLADAMKESGKFNKTTSKVEKQKKIDGVNIDFDADNTLPGLNREDLEELGKEDKPVLLKKSVIDRNLSKHPDVGKSEYDFLIGQALYNNPTFFPGHKDDYMNLVTQTGDSSNSLVLIEMTDNKENYEIVHLMKINDKNLKRMKKK